MRAIVFVAMVFIGLLAQYLLTEWLETDSTAERKKTWDGALDLLTHYYTKCVKNLYWMMTDSNWKYVFIVPSRAKIYKAKQSRQNPYPLHEELGLSGIKIINVGDTRTEGNRATQKASSPPKQQSSSAKSSSEAVKEEDYFAKSSEPRYPRPTSVKFRVGQVVKHARYGYYGVIVGWDEVAKAPEEWIRKNHPKGKEHWRKHPNYSVLVDTKHEGFDYSYCAQENLVAVKNVQINHPDITKFFTSFDGRRYHPLLWLRKMYPSDFDDI
jgi:hemimethylated DNA binding protein